MTNLIDALNYVGSCLDRGGQIDMIYMDMSKAFDKVNHDVLIQKLRNNYCMVLEATCSDDSAHI